MLHRSSWVGSPASTGQALPPQKDPRQVSHAAQRRFRAPELPCLRATGRSDTHDIGGSTAPSSQGLHNSKFPALGAPAKAQRDVRGSGVTSAASSKCCFSALVNTVQLKCRAPDSCHSTAHPVQQPQARGTRQYQFEGLPGPYLT